MPITTFNSDYYDDYTLNAVGEKNYVKILFKPGYSVQVRELNQMQSMLQDQIHRLGSTIYNQDKAILGCKVNFNPIIDRIDFKLTLDPNLSKATILENITTITSSNNLIATVIGYKDIEESTGQPDKVRFYVKYTNSGNDGRKTFQYPTDAIFQFALNTEAAPELAGYSVIGSLTDETSVGWASGIFTDEGIFYVNGSFVALPKQTLFVDHLAESEVLVGVVAYRVYENIITYTDDETLVDNSAGTLNYTAPGADRYQIDLELEWFTTSNWNIRDNTIQYIKIGEIQNSRLSEMVNPNSQESLYKQIDKTMALRTQEESGNYTVNPFPLILKDLYNGQKLPGRLMVAGNRYKIEALGTGYTTAQWIEVGVADALSVKVGTEFIAIGALPPTLIGALVTEVAFINGMYTWDDLDLIPGYEQYYTISSTDNDKLTAISKAKESFVATLDKSVGYVDGYRVHLNSPINIETKKARTRETFPLSVSLTYGNYFVGTASGSAFDLPPINLLGALYELRGAVDGGGALLGTCKIKSYEAGGGNDFIAYIYDETVLNLQDVKSIKRGNFVFNINSVLNERTKKSLVYALPYEECDPNTGVTNAFISAYRYYSGPSTTGNTLTLNVGSELNETYDDASSFIVYVGGVRITSGISMAPDSKGVTITHNQGASKAYSVIAAVTTNTPATQKILTTTTTTRQYSEAVSGIFTLSTTDIVEIISVINDKSGIKYDATSSFIISDSGLKDTHYTNSKIKYIGSGTLSGSFTIKYRYLGRKGGGALRYYTANSYSSIARQYIPTTGNISLRDTLDFRPDLLIGSLPSGILPNPNSTFRANAQYYLPRIDKVVVNSNNTFTVVEGTPALQPSEQATPANAMSLYILNVPAYTADVSKIQTQYIDNRRYTMRDIAKLDKRIGNLEYYTSLSLLERSATEKSIFDPAGERTKNGIIVDSFLNHSIGDSASKSHVCSLDRKKGILRPGFLTNLIDLDYNESSGANTNIKVHSNCITLNYTEKILFDQLVAVDHMSVQPYLFAQTVGNIELYPPVDNWKDTEILPDRIVEDDSAFRGLQELTKANPQLIGYDWENWELVSSKTVLDSQNTVSSIQSGGNGIRQVNTTTSVFDVTNTFNREGTFTALGFTTVEKSLGESVTDVNLIPFMRARKIYFRGSAFKPNTQLYSFFDGINVSQYVSPVLNYEGWINAAMPRISGDDARRRAAEAHIFNNAIPPFPAVPTDSVPYSQGWRSYGSQLTTDENGNIYGSFIVPNNIYLRFRTGEREFKLTESSRNLDSSDTYGMTKYAATGLTVQKQETILSIKEPEFTVTPVSETRSVERVETTTTQTFGNWYDPLAQSFVIDSKTYREGLFLTSIDLYFSKKAATAPVSIYIVPTINGYPTQKIVPFSRVSMAAADVKISSNATAATTFKFSNPVFLQADGEYAFIVESPDPDYKTWIAVLGPDKTDVTTGLTYTKQEYLGVFFTSSNASTWTPHQEKDLKFTMRRAEFNTGAGVIKFDGVIPTSIDTITITNGGSGYTSAPTVTIAAPPASPVLFSTRTATAIAIIDTVTAAVTGIKITDSGLGYTSSTPPTITISAPPNGGTRATAVTSLYTRYLSVINCAQNSISFDRTTVKNELVLDGKTTTPILINKGENRIVPKGLADVGSNKFGVGSPCILTTTITSNDSALSPVIDINKNSLIIVENVINSESSLFVGSVDTELSASNGTAKARYLTRPVSLDFGADKVNIYISVNRPSSTTNILVYARALTAKGDDTNIYDDSWTLLAPSKVIPVNSNPNIYNEIMYEHDPALEFGMFQIKIVMVSNNIIEMPTVKDFRAIATV
jgi:hypothetical protein